MLAHLRYYLFQKPKRQKSAKPHVKKKKKQVVHKVKKDKKNKVTTVKFANGTMKEDEALMDNAGFDDTEMTEIKVEVPQVLEVVEETEVGSLYKVEPPHDKTNKMTCAPSEDSDLPGHLPD